MNVEAINLPNTAQFQLSKGSDQVSEARKKVADLAQSEQVEKKQIQPEELLKQIKGLTEDGLFSVRFENAERTSDLVVKSVDRETDEVIRQIPVEEVLEMKAVLEDLRGNIVDTKS